MSRSSREIAINALITKLSTLSFLASAPERRLKLFSDVPSGSQPALFLVTPHNVYQPRPRGLPSKLTIQTRAVIFFQTGDPTTVPSIVADTILDAIDAVLAPSGPDNVQTLGGIIDHCWIEGQVMIDPGDLDGQGLIVVPIMLLLP